MLLLFLYNVGVLMSASEFNIISDDYLINVCRYRQAECCKYIIFFENVGNFYCVKNAPELRERIEAHASEMAAKGDNCEGLEYETRSKSEGASHQAGEAQESSLRC